MNFIVPETMAPVYNGTEWPWPIVPTPKPEDLHDLDLPRITIVTPSYNQGAFLEETIRSVLFQGYPNLEYIVVDGGSTDNSVNIIRSYEDQIDYWVSEPDRGQSHAINKGFHHATGDILAWLNSDDRLRPNVLWAAARTFCQHPQAGLVYAYAAICDQNGQSLHKKAGKAFDFETMVSGDNCVAQPSAFFRRAIFQEVGELDEALHYVMDMDLWLKIALKSEVFFINEIWSDFRHHANSKTGQGDLSFLQEIEQVIQQLFTSDSVPESLHHQRNAILAGLATKLAFRHYQAANDGQALRNLMQAIYWNPALLSDADWWALIPRCLFGRQRVLQLKSIFAM